MLRISLIWSVLITSYGLHNPSSFRHSTHVSRALTISAARQPIDSPRNLPGQPSTAMTALPLRAYPEKVDNFAERIVIFLLSWVLSRFLTKDELKSEARGILRVGMSFSDFCKMTKLLIRRSNGPIETVQQRIVDLLELVIPKSVRKFFQKTYKTNPRLVSEQSSEWIQRFGLLGWLIGTEVERFDVPVTTDPTTGTVEMWKSGLELKQCRYLLESGCKSTCVNICKIPTQNFFGTVLGLPLNMVPDYSTGACKFVFGETPPPREADPAFQSSCYLGCSLLLEKTKLESTKCT